MRPRKINLARKDEIEALLGLKQHSLSAYSLSGIYIWRGIYEIFSAPVGPCECIFFKDQLGCFAYLPPLGNDIDPQVIAGCFRIMDDYNPNKAVSRIENVEEAELSFFTRHGYVHDEKPGEYICKREELAGLKGDRFKSKRAACNFFASNYKFTYRPFRAQDKEGALELYRSWADERGRKSKDKIYLGMMRDNLSAQTEAMDNFRELGLSGRVIEINGKMRAYTIGYPLNEDTFCILFEITDLSVKGAAQYIFRTFCAELGYKNINIMDDSGLDNLKKVKLSYHPARIVPSYIIKRRDV